MRWSLTHFSCDIRNEKIECYELLKTRACVSCEALQRVLWAIGLHHTVKPVLETTCIKRPPALKDRRSDTAIFLKST